MTLTLFILPILAGVIIVLNFAVRFLYRRLGRGFVSAASVLIPFFIWMGVMSNSYSRLKFPFETFYYPELVTILAGCFWVVSILLVAVFRARVQYAVFYDRVCKLGFAILVCLSIVVSQMSPKECCDMEPQLQIVKRTRLLTPQV